MATALFAAPILPPAGQWFDNSGDPLNGGKVYIYVAGTTTNETSYPTYDDALAGTNANANPVVLDANGRAQVWLQSERQYKVVVKDSTDATTFQTMDDYSPGQGYATPVPSEWVPESNTVSYSTTTQFIVSGVNVTSRYHKGRRIKVTCTGGTFYGSIVSSSFATNTTCTVVLDGGNVLDAGLSAIWYAFTSSEAQTTSPSSVRDPVTLINAYRATNQVIGGAGWVKVQIDTEDLDLLNEFDSSTNYRFTPNYQSNGGSYNQRYLFNAQVTLSASIVSCQIAIYKNGSAVIVQQENSGIANGTLSITWLEFGPSSAGNYYELYINPSAAVSVVGGSTATRLQIVRL